MALAQGFAVEGRIVDALTGRPLARASVSLRPAGEDAQARPDALRGPSSGLASGLGSGSGNRPASTQQPPSETTGSDGNFRFSSVPAGRYRLSATSRGYLPGALEQHGSFYAALVVGPSTAGTGPIRFALQPLATISGTVLDSSGDPVLGATVSLFAESPDGTGEIRLRQTASLTRGSAEYEFANLQPGTYYLAVAARPWFAESNTDTNTPNALDVAYPVTFFDGADRAGAAQPLTIKAGDAIQANFSLRAVPAVHLTVPPSGAGNRNALPDLSAPAFGTSIPVTLGQAFGRTAFGGEGSGPTVTFSVAPGTYQVRQGGTVGTVQASSDTALTAAGPSSVKLSARVGMADGSALPAGSTLRLIPAGGFGGNAGGRFGGVFDGAPVPNGNGGDPGSEQGRGGFFGARPLELRLGADGVASLDAVPAGNYRLSVTLLGLRDALVEDGAASGAQLSTQTRDLLLRVGADPVLLAVTVGVGSGTASGRVVGPGGRPESGVMVLLMPSGPGPAALFRAGESDSDGTWTIRGVVPGSYTAVAIRDGWDLAWTRADTMRRYLPGGQAITVGAGTAPAPAQPLVAPAR